MQRYTDEQLMTVYQSNTGGQGAMALDHLYQRYARRMLNYFYFALNNDYAKAQDFLHDLFLKIIENHHSFDNSQYFQAWIYRIASNMCKNEFRSAKVIHKYNEHLVQSAKEVIVQDESESFMRQCIQGLTPEHRSLIVMRFKLKLSVKEIADIYECPEGTVKSRLFYATKELSKLYKK